TLRSDPADEDDHGKHEHDDVHSHAREPEGSHARHMVDPHAWQDPHNVERYVLNIAEALSRIDPLHASVYASRSTAYIQKLNELDAWIQAQVATVPNEHRRVIVSHASLDYYGER